MLAIQIIWGLCLLGLSVRWFGMKDDVGMTDSVDMHEDLHLYDELKPEQVAATARVWVEGLLFAFASFFLWHFGWI